MASKKRLFTYFRNVQLIGKSTNDWWRFNCTFCGGHDTRAVHFGKGCTKCFKCPGEGYFTLTEFVAAAEGIDEDQVRAFLEDFQESEVDFTVFKEFKIERKEYTGISLPYGYKSLMSGTGSIAKRARKYLSGRGFDLEYLDKEGVGYCDEEPADRYENYFGRVIIPFKNELGVLYYFEGRTFIDEDPKYKNPSELAAGIGKAELLYGEHLLYLHEEVVLCEGLLDGLTLSNGIASKGKKLSSIQKGKILKSPCETIVVGLDPDARKEALDICYDLCDFKKIKLLDLPHGEDINSMGRKYVEDAISMLSLETKETILDKIFALC